MESKVVANLVSSTLLFVRIPWRQDGRHVVEITGNFQSGQGVELHAHNPHNAEISRVRELSLTDNRFRFEDLNLNQTGYDFYIWLNNTNYTVVEATPETYFQVVTREFVAADSPAFKPMFENP